MHGLFRTTALAVLIAAGAAPAALAQSQPGKETACWSRVATFDANADRLIDVQEIAKNKDAMFTALDRNNDGFLAREEYEGCLTVQGADAAGMEQAFARFDGDRD